MNEIDQLRSEMSDSLNEKIAALKAELTVDIAKLSDQLTFMEKSNVETLDGLRFAMDEKMGNLENSLKSGLQSLGGQVEHGASSHQSTQDQLRELFERIDDVNEKLYEFETNKKNNLIFYGIQGETRETPSQLQEKV